MKFGCYLELHTGPDSERGVTGVTSLQDSANGERFLVAQVCHYQVLVLSQNTRHNGVGMSYCNLTMLGTDLVLGLETILEQRSI